MIGVNMRKNNRIERCVFYARLLQCDERRGTKFNRIAKTFHIDDEARIKPPTGAERIAAAGKSDCA